MNSPRLLDVEARLCRYVVDVRPRILALSGIVFCSFAGLGRKRRSQPVPRSRLAARLRRAPVGREEQVLRVPAHDVTDGEAHPTRHHAHVPRPPVLQGEGRAWAGEPLQRHEGGCTLTIIYTVHEKRY